MIEIQLKEAVRSALESGWTLRGFGEKAGVASSQLSYWLNGHRSITVETAGRIANALGMHLTVPRIPKDETFGVTK